MSAFLGPIHQLMYQKILYTETVLQKLLGLLPEAEARELLQELEQVATAPVKAPLEDIVDTSNIHGWLSQEVEKVERRYALVREALLRGGEERLEAACGLLRQMGEEVSLHQPVQEGKQLELLLRHFLLDGMPCDRGVDLFWEGEALCLRVNHWLHDDPTSFWRLRLAWLEGLLSRSSFVMSEPAPQLLVFQPR